MKKANLFTRGFINFCSSYFETILIGLVCIVAGILYRYASDHESIAQSLFAAGIMLLIVPIANFTSYLCLPVYRNAIKQWKDFYHTGGFVLIALSAIVCGLSIACLNGDDVILIEKADAFLLIKVSIVLWLFTVYGFMIILGRDSVKQQRRIA